MSGFQASGSARPSKWMSKLSAGVGLGMLFCIVMFFVSPIIGAIVFVALFLATLAGIIIYHVRNAAGDDGVPHSRFSLQANRGGSSKQGDFDERMRDLERLRQDEIISEEEYRRKRTDILEEDW